MYTYVGGLFLRKIVIYLNNVRGRENALFISPKKKYVSVNSLYSGKHKSSHEQKMLQSGSIYLYFREIYCITYRVLFCDERMKWQHIIPPFFFFKIRLRIENAICWYPHLFSSVIQISFILKMYRYILFIFKSHTKWEFKNKFLWRKWLSSNLLSSYSR